MFGTSQDFGTPLMESIIRALPNSIGIELYRDYKWFFHGDLNTPNNPNPIQLQFKIK